MKRLTAVIVFLMLAVPCMAAETSEIRYKVMSCSHYLIHVNFPDGTPQINDFDFAKALRKLSGDWTRSWTKDDIVLAPQPKSKTVIDLTVFKAWLNEALRTKAQAIVELPGPEDCPAAPKPPTPATTQQITEPANQVAGKPASQ